MQASRAAKDLIYKIVKKVKSLDKSKKATPEQRMRVLGPRMPMEGVKKRIK